MQQPGANQMNVPGQMPQMGGPGQPNMGGGMMGAGGATGQVRGVTSCISQLDNVTSASTSAPDKN